MLALLVERDYEEITVLEITERADLNRATFYLHFNHKDELLAAALEARFDELVASFGDYQTMPNAWGDLTPEILTFRHVAEHAALYKVLLSDRGMGQVIYRIINYIARFSQTKMMAPDAHCLKSGVPQVIIAQHIAGSLFALLSWWIANNMPYTPEEMAEMVHHLCVNGVDAPINPPIAKGVSAKAQK
jgi:AcrR family transcriptional regulator